MKFSIILRAILGTVALACAAVGNFPMFVLLALSASSIGYVPSNFLACTITPITKENCKSCRAGISCIWLTNCVNVLDFTFDANRCVTGIVMDTSQVSPTFKKIEFEKDTAFFSQPKVKIKNSTSVTQTISFVEACMSPELRNALEDMNDCCCAIAIVKDNSGQYHVAGITYNKDTDEWQTEDMATGEGSANTGTDPTADSNEYIETLTANVGFYAPFYKGGEASIPV